MRHKVISRKFGRSSSHRGNLLARLARCLIEEKRIVTTLCRAKAARSLAEKMVTLSRAGSLGARRRAAATLRCPDAAKVLFEQIAPHFQGRPGGYTRIIRLGARRGDNTEMAILEWVGISPADKKKKPAPASGDKK